MEVRKHNEFVLNFDTDEPFDAVFIIGNGFDKSLNLKTAYTDYIKSSIFKEIVNDGNEFANYLLEQSQLVNWIDIENELSIYSLSEKSLKSDFYKDFNALSNNLINYLLSLDYSKLEKESLAFKLMEKLSYCKALVLDFNYTDTTKFLLREIPLADINITHIKVHGTVSDKNIIFGVDDKSEIRDEHIFLKKSVYKNYRATNFSEFLEQSNSIGVFGHSLGKTDHMYFSDFFSKSLVKGNKMSNKDISIYYFKENGRLDLHKQLDKLTHKSIAKFKQSNNVKFYNTEIDEHCVSDNAG